MSSVATAPTASASGGRALAGIPVVPGVGAGSVIRPAERPLLPQLTGEPAVSEEGRPAELERFQAAAGVVAERLEGRATRASGAAAEVLEATAGLARDRGLLAAVAKRVKSGVPADQAVVGAADQFSAMFTQLGGLMAERVTDLADLRDRLVAELTGQAEPGVPVPAVPSVLLADDLAPADTAGLQPELILAIATTRGGPTSHTAIIARQLGIPCVVAVAGLDDVATGQFVLVDGTSGEVVIEPDRVHAAARVEAAEREAAAVAAWTGPGATADGHTVDVLANVQDGAGARKAAATGAQGVGLFRTELCFLDADSEPSVAEQARIYGEVFAAFAGREGGSKVVLRTLDAGSDKPLKFATAPDEENPALGVRGLRIAWGQPGILDRQLDAIALAAEQTGTSPWVMAPMVATAAEARDFATKVRARGLTAGVMIEIPAAALHAERILREVDFLSIGTNDLCQYTLAADRLSADLAHLNDPWQPALLQLVAMTAAAGVAAGKPVGVCGEAAADPLLGAVLAGMGVTSLSCAASAISAVGARLAQVELAACQKAARAAVAADDPAAARAAARESLLGV
ncbi:phosphoenolpyruvate--protein phosphotransferase [Quadrisphaera granulorum]|uniref:Phosphoenolpyruvate-protein phosphotransferase n=1 Tax=Quadrisphaera granulorum TaxID=317664 RepID=A0A316A0H3_9ACTN|nr:putative PEP-binding protein [Quadrisphaera granulorum]PWJ50214.1 phosphoenolpyruvate--protein phosphotransferase [Quadrisphaera granulorum]SZE97980.1 phosphoenolpyruvate--protein phosphotransferase [Quadrisphaera granulorum]